MSTEDRPLPPEIARLSTNPDRLRDSTGPGNSRPQRGPLGKGELHRLVLNVLPRGGVIPWDTRLMAQLASLSDP